MPRWNKSEGQGDERIELPLRDGGGMSDQMREFARAITEGDEPEASGKNVRRTMAALEAAKISLGSGEPVQANAL